jgi:hypothetical protein
MIHNLQTIPIYYEFLSSSKLSIVHNEINTVVSELKEKNLFNLRQGWDTSFKISDTTNNNILNDSRLSEFVCEIDRSVRAYYEKFNLDINQIKEFRIVESWATSSFKNNFTNNHSHELADISGCYYFKTNEKDGSIYFNPPNKLWGKISEPAYFAPVEGKLILFPSCLIHGVTENTFDSERISIAFQMVLIRYD